MKGGGRAEHASDGDEKEGAGRGASLHAEQHEQPGVHLEISGTRSWGFEADERMLSNTKTEARCRLSRHNFFAWGVKWMGGREFDGRLLMVVLSSII
jgi:hypothetical protein